MMSKTERPAWTPRLLEGAAWWLAFVLIVLNGIDAFWFFERGTVARLLDATSTGQAMPVPSTLRLAATAAGLLALMTWALLAAPRARLLQRIAQAAGLVLALAAGMLTWGKFAVSGTQLSVALSALSTIDAEQVVAQSHARALVDGLIHPQRAAIYRDANGRFLEMQRTDQQRAITLAGVSPSMCSYILHWVLAQQTDLGIEEIQFATQRVHMPESIGLPPSLSDTQDIRTRVCRGDAYQHFDLTLFVPLSPAAG